MAQTASIEIDKHMAIIGETGEGKTPIANNLFQNVTTRANAKAHSLYVDFEDMGEVKADVRVDLSTDDLSRIEEAFREGKSVSVVPSEDKERRIKQIKGLWKYLKTLNLVIVVFADEIQEYGKEEANPFTKFAVRGQKYGIHLVSITQRVAKLPKTIGTQSNVILHFHVSELEERYYRDNGLPADKILPILSKTPKHSFVLYIRGSGVSSPMMLDL